jgi:hypothetical protein
MLLRDVITFFRMPRVSINLMLEQASQNDPFYSKLVKLFYQDAQSRHRKLFFVGKYAYGFALCALPKDFHNYFIKLKSSTRNEYRKALRLGYRVRRFDFNAHLEEIHEILQSTPVRQGELPREIREGCVQPIANPPSRTPYHDYPYFGVFKEDKLVAYAGCMILGEMCHLNEIYGHASYQKDCIVHLLILEIAAEIFKSYPVVRYYSYDTYFGASDSLRHFKRKFLFYPHRATWTLGGTVLQPPPLRKADLVYQTDLLNRSAESSTIRESL